MTASPWTIDGSNPAPGIPAELDQTLDTILWSGYDPDGDAIIAVRHIASLRDALGFRGEQLRRQGSYAYARLTVTYRLQPLTWGQCCIDQPDARAKIADAAWGALEAAAKFGISRQQVRRYVDTFCYGLETAWVEFFSPPPVSAARSGWRASTATDEQKSAIRSMRGQLGITDTSDLPEPLSFERAARMIEHLGAQVGRADRG